jgi:hypothetical protein
LTWIAVSLSSMPIFCDSPKGRAHLPDHNEYTYVVAYNVHERRDGDEAIQKKGWSLKFKESLQIQTQNRSGRPVVMLVPLIVHLIPTLALQLWRACRSPLLFFFPPTPTSSTTFRHIRHQNIDHQSIAQHDLLPRATLWQHSLPVRVPPGATSATSRNLYLLMRP